MRFRLVVRIPMISWVVEGHIFVGMTGGSLPTSLATRALLPRLPSPPVLNIISEFRMHSFESYSDKYRFLRDRRVRECELFHCAGGGGYVDGSIIPGGVGIDIYKKDPVCTAPALTTPLPLRYVTEADIIAERTAYFGVMRTFVNQENSWKKKA
jgi:hypothetical protein